LFDADEAAALSRTLPADREVTFRVRLPSEAASPGVFVFISPVDTGELPESWAAVLDRNQLLWVAADGFGNSRPTAERMLVAVMALKLAQRLRPINGQRRYVSGMSGGGRVASQCITHFPQHFDGGLFMVGADFFMPREPQVARLLETRRLVFLTGSLDFNRREIRGVYRDYGKAGVSGLLLIDEDGFGHAFATAAQLSTALDFLDAREVPQRP
jgi:hypothetical protein